MHKVNIMSLGCAKNLVDAEVMAGMLRERGYDVAADPGESDVLIVNTCGFIDAAKEESISAIMDAAENKKTGRCRALVVTGCLAQRYKDDILAEIPEVDALLGTGDVPRIIEAVEQALHGGRLSEVTGPSYLYNHETPRLLSTPKHYAYVKIAEGCNNRCAYCAIPSIRGDYHSREMDSIVAEAANLAAAGVREINLIAQDTTRYGLDLYGEYRLAALLQKLTQIGDLAWIRMLYGYPTRFTDELIETIAKNDKICKYLDIPLQHADDVILAAMNRQGTNREILNLIERLRSNIPGLTLRTSFIVGFPGETEERFQILADFVKTVRFDRVGVFTYSPEEGTSAHRLPGQVPDEVKEERKDRLMRIQQEISLANNQQKIGQIISVLIEGKDLTEHEEVYQGRTQADAPEVDGQIFVTGKNLGQGDIVPVRITHAYEYDLIGETTE